MATRKDRSHGRRILRISSNNTTSVPSMARLVDVLAQGKIVACKELPWGSNYSFAVAVALPDNEQDSILAIYKPRRGEVPLWDFPDGTLYLREYASYLLSQFLGWDFIPPTVIREGPYGIGTIQLYVEPDEGVEYEQLYVDHPLELERIAVFDLVTNNADRKLSHLLRDRHGKLWGIDHGLTFNAVPKLRTVIWDFCGRPFAPSIRADLEQVVQSRVRLTALRSLLASYLSTEEVEETLRRLRCLADLGVHPRLDPYRNYPRGFW